MKKKLSRTDSRSEFLAQLLAAHSPLHECCLKFIVILAGSPNLAQAPIAAATCSYVTVLVLALAHCKLNYPAVVVMFKCWFINTAALTFVALWLLGKCSLRSRPSAFMRALHFNFFWDGTFENAECLGANITCCRQQVDSWRSGTFVCVCSLREFAMGDPQSL